jgi:uncharacterized membrane protein YccC
VIGRAIRDLVELEGMLDGVWAELREMAPRGPRARQATVTALAVAIAAAFALLGHMDMPWWAGISGFMSVQATRPGSVTRAMLRNAGSVTGAAVALLISPVIVRDHVAGSLFLFAAAFVAMLGSLVSRHAYAWLFFGITANLVVLMAIDDPATTLHIAGYRVMEVALGSAAALIVVALLAPADPPAPAPAAAGWTDLLGARWPAVLHAVRSGVAVMLLPWAWALFELPSLSQMAITVAAVMAIPVLSDHPLEDGRKIAGRAAQRIVGCFAGGAVAVAVLPLTPTSFVPWLLVLMAGVWVASWVQTSTRGVGYVGTQAAIVWIMMIVQGWGPPSSILPGLDRFGGILAGLAILLVVSLLFWPEERGGAEAPPVRAAAS